MAHLVSHLQAQPPLRVVSETQVSKRTKSGMLREPVHRTDSLAMKVIFSIDIFTPYMKIICDFRLYAIMCKKCRENQLANTLTAGLASIEI